MTLRSPTHTRPLFERWLGASVLTALLCGCAPALNHLSAGKVNCPPDRVQISDVQAGDDVTRWTARCNGKTHHCSGRRTAQSATRLEEVSCERFDAASPRIGPMSCVDAVSAAPGVRQRN